jgi:hypothetical protein
METMLRQLNTLEGWELREIGDKIRKQLHTGEITYELATEKMAIVLEEVNKRGAVIAKKYGKKHHPITTIAELR